MSELCAWDLDGTMRPGAISGEAVSYAIDLGILDPMHFKNPKEPGYSEVRHFLAAITNSSRRNFDELLERISDEATEQLYPWAEVQLEQHNPDHHVVIFSHSADFVVKAFARGIERITHAQGSFFHTQQHVFSGRAKTLNKQRALSRYITRKSLGSVAFAAGDSEADIPMLLRAERSVVVNPKESLLELAEQNNWKVITT